MKVLFLDFDGVLHPTTPGLDPFFVKAPLLDQALVGFQIPMEIFSIPRSLKNKPPKRAERKSGGCDWLGIDWQKSTP
jgi:hypothetical protein